MGGRFSAPVHTGPGAHPASCTMGTGSFPVVKSGRGVTLTPHRLLLPWSRKSRAIPLPPMSLQPLQSLSAFTTMHFTFTFTSALCPPQISRRSNWDRNQVSAVRDRRLEPRRYPDLLFQQSHLTVPQSRTHCFPPAKLAK